MDRATGKMLGIDGSAISSMTGQLLTSAEIEEVGRLSCGALGLEFDAEEDAAREGILRATSDGWQACTHGIRSRRRAVTD